MKRTKTKLMALAMALAVMLTLYSVQAFAASEGNTEKVEVLEKFTNTSTAIRVNWNSIEDASGYRVYMNVDGEWVKLITIYGEDTTTCRVADLLPQTDYEFMVRAFFKSDSSTMWTDDSETIFACTDPLDVEVSEKFSATLQAVRINWEETSIASGYRVYMNVDGEWVKLATLYGSDKTTYRIAELLPQTDYEFMIKAFYKSDYPTIWSDDTSIINVCTDSLDVQHSSKFSATISAIRINWEETYGVSGYRVYEIVDGQYVKLATIYGSDTTTFRMSALVPNSEHCYVVRSFYKTESSTLWGDYSSEIVACTDELKVELSQKYDTEDGAIQINWKKLDGVSGYRVYIIEDGEYVNKETIYGDYKTRSTIGHLAKGTIYEFAIRAFIKINGETIWSDYSETITTMSAMDIPEFLIFERATNSITLSWSTVYGATGYKVYYKVGSTWKTGATVYSGSITSAKVSGLSENSTYEFKVVAFSKDISPVRWSWNSEIVELTTLKSKVTIPETIELAAYSLTSSSIKLTWTPVDCSGYIVYYYDGSDWQILDYIYSAEADYYKLTDLSSNTRYVVGVAAYYSNESELLVSEDIGYVDFTTK